MVLVICIALAVIAIVFTIMYVLDVWDQFADGFIAIVSGIVMVALIIWLCVDITNIKTEHVIDRKIAMYKEENARIESQMDELVSSYKTYETETFGKFGMHEDAVTLVSFFPELKSDVLVQKQIDTYVENN